MAKEKLTLYFVDKGGRPYDACNDEQIMLSLIDEHHDPVALNIHVTHREDNPSRVVVTGTTHYNDRDYNVTITMNCQHYQWDHVLLS